MNKKQKTLFQTWNQGIQKSTSQVCQSTEKHYQNGYKNNGHSNKVLQSFANALSDQGSSNHCPKALAGFNMDAGQTWIYPTNVPIRDYQFSIVKECLFKNTMVVLPTGLGKTFIAAVVMYNLHRWYPDGKVVFMAPTRPLVSQQREACFQITGISPDDTVQMTGTNLPSERKLTWMNKRVFFLTPQTLANDLARNICPASSIKCLVIDEAHKALGNHAYCEVVRQLLSFSSEFRVLALTATPGSDTQAVKQVISNLLIAHVELRTEDSDDIKPYTHARNVEKIVVPLGEELTSLKSTFLDIINIYLKRLQQRKAISARNPSSLSKFQMFKLRENFSKNPPEGIDRRSYGLIIADFALCISLYHAYELLLHHGVKPFYQFLMGILDGDKSIPHSRAELQKNFEFGEMMDYIKEHFTNQNSVLSSNSSKIQQEHSFASEIQNISDKFVAGHPKLEKLEQIVLAHFERGTIESTGSRVIVFSQYRDSVKEIEEMLKRHHPIIKVMSFVGQATKSGSNKGISQKDQLKVVQQFREGGFNTLISTCVGEEGLDIGEVDLIICYDCPKSPIRLVQRMGRTGRQREGRIVVLVTEGKEEQMYNSSEYQKKSIFRAIKGGFSFAEFYQHSPRMVPNGIQPVCVKTVMKIEAKTNIQQNSKKRKKTSATLNGEERLYFEQHLKLPDSDVLSLPSASVFVTLPILNSHHAKSNVTSESISFEDELISKKKFLSVSDWMPWQLSPQSTYKVSHSAKTLSFIDAVKFMNNPDQIPTYEERAGNKVPSKLNSNKNSKDLKSFLNLLNSKPKTVHQLDNAERITEKEPVQPATNTLRHSNDEEMIVSFHTDDVEIILIDDTPTTNNNDNFFTFMDAMIQKSELSEKKCDQQRQNLEKRVPPSNCDSSVMNDDSKLQMNVQEKLYENLKATLAKLNTLNYSLNDENSITTVFDQFQLHSKPTVQRHIGKSNLGIEKEPVCVNYSKFCHHNNNEIVHCQCHETEKKEPLIPSRNLTGVSLQSPVKSCDEIMLTNTMQKFDLQQISESNDESHFKVPFAVKDVASISFSTKTKLSCHDVKECPENLVRINNSSKNTKNMDCNKGFQNELNNWLSCALFSEDIKEYESTILLKEDGTSEALCHHSENDLCESKMDKTEKTLISSEVNVTAQALKRKEVLCSPKRNIYDQRTNETVEKNMMLDSSLVSAHKNLSILPQTNATQYSLTQLASLIDHTQNAPCSSVNSAVEKKFEANSTDSEEEICPTPPKETGNNRISFSYKSSQDNKTSHVSASMTKSHVDLNEEHIDCFSGDSESLLKHESINWFNFPDTIKLDEPPANKCTEKYCEQESVSSIDNIDNSKTEVQETFIANVSNLPANKTFNFPLKTQPQEIPIIEACSILENEVSNLPSKTSVQEIPVTDILNFPQDEVFNLSFDVDFTQENIQPTCKSITESAIPKTSTNSSLSLKRKRSQNHIPENKPLKQLPTCEKSCEDDDFDFKVPKKLKAKSKKIEKLSSKPKKMKHDVIAKEYLIEEAEVSDEHGSQDDSDGSDLDQFDESFIDDNSHVLQNYTNDHGHYLQSVKDCVGVLQPYKLKFCPRNVDVFSQPVEETVADYMLDSFCVGNDDIVYLSSENDSPKRKMKKPKKKKRKRIVTLDSNSSSEDKTPVKHKKYSSLTQSSSKNSVALFTTETDLESRCNFEVLETIEQNSEQSEPKVGELPKVDQTKMLNLPSLPDKCTNQCQNVHLPNYVQTDAVLQKAQENLSMVQVEEEMNISFDITWDDPSETLSKPDNNPDTSDFLQKKSNPLAMQANIIPKSLFSPSLVSKHSKLCKQSTSKLKENLSTIVPSTLSVTTQNSVVSSNSSHTETRNLKHLESKNLTMNLNSTTLNPCLNLSDSSRSKLVILISTGELAASKTVINVLRTQYSVECVVMQLPDADYIVSNRMAISRVLDSEFFTVQNTAKVIKKVKAMKELYEKCIIIIEKDLRKQLLGPTKDLNRHLDFSLIVLQNTSMKILHSESMNGSAKLLHELALGEQKRNMNIEVPVNLMGNEQQIYEFYASLPHVTPICALNFLHRFPTLKHFLESSEEELKNAGCISSSRAHNIHWYLRANLGI